MEKVSSKESRSVGEAVARLKKSGYQFDFEETADEFIIGLVEVPRKIHITKIANPDVDFEKIIEASVRFPDKKLADALKAIAEQNK